jgi:hypothetical protein
MRKFFIRHKACALNWIALCFFIISGYSSAVVFGDGNSENGIEDQRRLAPQTLLSYSGTIHCDGRLRGSGSHIQLPAEYGPNSRTIVLTAAHILYHPRTGTAYKNCFYLPQGKRLSKVAFGPVSEHHYDPLSSDKVLQASNDLVFVALNSSLSNDGVKLQIDNLRSHWLMLLGYNGEQENISLSDDCHQFQSHQFASDSLLFHDCDADSGASGGAIIDPQSGALVAIHGGTLLLDDASSELAGIPADADVIINQGRKIDGDTLDQLRRFIAYLATDFPD